jgi:hypothetical protein
MHLSSDQCLYVVMHLVMLPNVRKFVVESVDAILPDFRNHEVEVTGRHSKEGLRARILSHHGALKVTRCITCRPEVQEARDMSIEVIW